MRSGLEHLLALHEPLARSPHHLTELHVLITLAYHRLGQEEESQAALSQALALAAPGGSKLPFLEAGAAIQELLAAMPEDEPHHLYAQSLIKTLEHVDPPPRRPEVPQGLAEPLTNRELDILALVSERLQNKQIAARLFVSAETVKTHLKNIYRKLGVSSRREAREAAMEIFKEGA